MSADNLPRPDGRWSVDPLMPTRVSDHNEEPVADTDSRFLAECIAALPERIRRLDAVREFCEERAEVTRAHGWLGGEHGGWVEVDRILALLDGEAARRERETA